MKCKCIKDYSVTARDYLDNKRHGPIYNKVIFKDGADCYYKIIKNVVYVSDTKEHLRHMNLYDTYIEDLTKEQFNIHFKTWGLKSSEEILVEKCNKWLIKYNELVDKLGNNDLFDPITEEEKQQLLMASKMIGMPIWEEIDYKPEISKEELEVKYERLKNRKLQLESSKIIMNDLVKKLKKNLKKIKNHEDKKNK